MSIGIMESAKRNAIQFGRIPILHSEKEEDPLSGWRSPNQWRVSRVGRPMKPVPSGRGSDEIQIHEITLDAG